MSKYALMYIFYQYREYLECVLST